MINHVLYSIHYAQVPDKYMCSYCQEPRLGRQSTLYRNPQHWLLASAAALPSLGEPLMAASDSVDRLGTLTALVSDLTALSGLLHSLQLKLHIAEQTNHPKVKRNYILSILTSSFCA